MKLVVADIDGCCTSVEHRVDMWLNGDMDNFVANWYKDTPIPQGVATYQMFLDDPQYRVLFVTARWEKWRWHTLETLRSHVCPYIESEQLLMRPDHLPAIVGPMPSAFKPWLLEAHGYKVSDVFLAFDDSQSIIDGWRALGVTAYLTAGNHK